MKKLADFIVKRRIIIVIVIALITVFCGFLIPKVKINADMSKYLPNNSQMKQGIELMEKELPEAKIAKTIRVMFENLNDEQKDDIKYSLESIKNVDSVSFDKTSSDYNSGNFTLYVLSTDCDYDSKEEIAIRKTVEENFADYSVIVRNDNTATSEIPLLVLGLALSMLLIILFVMCGSWIEPLLFIVTIGIAIVINLGTNIVLGSVSTITFSIGAILQLVLSMDYSIILTNRYRQEKKSAANKVEAMKIAIHKAFPSIVSSGMTTVVGLLMLLFMSFSIGTDLGIVLAKGVLISMLCVFLILPFLLIAFDKLVEKTSKREVNIPMSKISTFGFKAKNYIAIGFCLLFIGVCFLQTTAETTYTLKYEDEIADVFEPTNSIAVLYDNDDENKIALIVEELSKNEKIKAVYSYPTTIGLKLSSAEMSASVSALGNMEVNTSLINIIYYDYFSAAEPSPLLLGEFISFTNAFLAENPELSSLIDQDAAANLASIAPFLNKEMLLNEASVAELSSLFGMTELEANQLLLLNYSKNGGSLAAMSPKAFIDFVVADVLNDPIYGAGLQDKKEELKRLQQIINAVAYDVKFSAEEIALFFGGAEFSSSVELLYLLRASVYEANAEWKMSIDEFFKYLKESVVTDVRFTPFISEELSKQVIAARGELDKSINALKGKDYSVLSIETLYAVESKDTSLFIKSLMDKCEASFSGEYYLIGGSVMNYEMEQGFGKEQILITILTALAIFIVIALTFKSAIIPTILVLIVQCGVFLTTSINGVLGNSVYYLALLIVQCILMGATVDYGILYTNYYRDSRKTMEIKEALNAAYKGSMHTVMTSGLIMILVTGIIGFCPIDPAIAQICRTIAIGALSATILILFVLPGLLAAFDKLIVRKKDRVKKPNKEQ